MKRMMILALALSLLLGGCGPGRTEPRAPGTAAATRPAQEGRPSAPETPSAPVPGQSEPAAAAPLSQGAEETDSSRGSIVQAVSGEGIEEISIYAELCAVVLEPSATDQLEAVFSFPEITAPNYQAHFALRVEQEGSAAAISTDYENGRWDTAFDPIHGVLPGHYREGAVLTVRLPRRQYQQVDIQLVTAGNTLELSGVDALALDVRINTGDVVIRSDQALPALSVSYQVGNVTLCVPELGGQLQVTGKIGVFTLCLPEEPADVALEIRYDREAVAGGDEAIFVLPVSWEATVSGQTVRYRRGAATRKILVDNQKYGVFAVDIDGVQTAEPASAR